MKIQSSTENIIFLKGENQYELASTFMRLQEYYESPKFCGEFPTLEEYMDWYASAFGNFTYFSDWNGFNVPGDVVREFFAECPHELLDKEKRLRDLLSEWIYNDEPFYVIGVHCQDNTIDHEFAHAFFYLDEDYRTEMTGLVNNLSKSFRDTVTGYLTKEGYHSHVYLDESQAYLATNTMMETDEMVKSKVPWNDVLELQRAFHTRYEVYQKLNEPNEK